MKIQILEDDRFYDYKTKPVKGKDIFDTTKTGMSFYDNFISDPAYMEKAKNLKAEIQYMTPADYFQYCAYIFNSNADKGINQVAADKDTIDHLKAVITEYGKQFPIPILDFANNTQEGRHRMYVAAQMFGWGEEFPVMVVDFADKEKAKEQENRKNKEEIERKLKDIARDVLEYKYSDIDEFKDELEYMADNKLRYYDELRDDFNVTEDNNSIVISTNGVSYTIDKSDITIRETPDIDYDDISFEDITDDDVEKALNSI